MQYCEFCGAAIAETDGAMIPGPAMNAALDRGYTPAMCPNWPALNQRVRSALEQERQAAPAPMPPVNDQLAFQRLNAMLRLPGKSWRLCNVCCSTLAGYLPPRSTETGFPTSGSGTDLDARLKYVLPINTSVWAIIAGYFGLFAVLLLPAPITLILGIIAWYDVKSKRRRGQKVDGMGRAVFAIVMGVLFSFLLGFFLLAVAAG